MNALLQVIAASRRRFNPLSLSPALWLSDTGSDASVWPDISGNGRNATQAVALNQPAIVTGVLNGRQVRRFDGATDYLATAANSPALSGGVEIFVVEKHPGFGGNGFGRIVEIGTAEIVYIVNATTSDAASYRLVSGALFAKNSAANSATVDTWRVAAISFNLGNLSSGATHRVNGASSAGSGVDSTSSIPAANSIFHIGNRPTLDRAFAGDIAEILIFPTALSTTNRQLVERYLGNKYGITVA